jgi:hypothetical protein
MISRLKKAYFERFHLKILSLNIWSYLNSPASSCQYPAAGRITFLFLDNSR